MEGNQSRAFRSRLAESAVAMAFSCGAFTTQVLLATARFMTAGATPKDYALQRSREVTVLVVGGGLAVLALLSGWMAVMPEPCYPVVVLTVALVVCAARRKSTFASTSAAPSFWAGVCQLAAHWVLADRLLCLAAAALDVQVLNGVAGFARMWWFVGQGWLLLMALLATTALSQAWSSSLQEAVVEMRRAEYKSRSSALDFEQTR